MFARQKRISVTFRQVRRKPCECKYLEFCDWDRNGQMALPKNDFTGKKLEEEYVYEQIAEHFDDTRRSNWGVINRFLDSLPKHSLVFDAGCGNGKYLIRKDSLIKVFYKVTYILIQLGCDICSNLVQICHQKNCCVFRADALNLPLRSESMDAVISVAVIHHLSTHERRLVALKELERVLRKGGRACITVWALEQKRISNDANVEESVYLKSRTRNAPPTSDSEDHFTNEINQKLKVHDGKDFRQQGNFYNLYYLFIDMLVPWNIPGSNNQAPILRYYHLFVAGELGNLIKSGLNSCRLVGDVEEYEEGNWAVIFEKL